MGIRHWTTAFASARTLATAPECLAHHSSSLHSSPGMTWSGFRPSDDASQLPYPIPANMYAAAGLERALELNRQVGRGAWNEWEHLKASQNKVPASQRLLTLPRLCCVPPVLAQIWQVPEFEAKAGRLLEDIKSGIQKHGVVQVDGTSASVYAYEVDGRGGSLTDFDDANSALQGVARKAHAAHVQCRMVPLRCALWPLCPTDTRACARLWCSALPGVHPAPGVPRLRPPGVCHHAQAASQQHNQSLLL